MQRLINILRALLSLIAPTQNPQMRSMLSRSESTTVCTAVSTDSPFTTSWPGANKLTSEKVPSELRYEGTDIRWGYELKPEEQRLRCLKLLLETDKEFPSFASRTAVFGQLIACGKTATDAVADYLARIYVQIQAELQMRYGSAMLAKTKIDYVMTVPAGWSDAAKDSTLKAAQKAGIGPSLRLISEPEAAIVYALKSMRYHELQIGDTFIVCDAGGGTVDLIACEVKSLNPLRLEECTEGIAALCGSAFLNMRFEDVVKKRMGEVSFEKLRERKPKSWAHALRFFEDYVKRNFDPLASQDVFDDSKHSVQFPGAEDNAEAGIDSGFLTLKTADVAEIFRPVVQKVLEMVESQKSIMNANSKAAKGLLLVGGLGTSEHLFKTLKATHTEHDPLPPHRKNELTPVKLNPTIPRFQIIKPQNAWTAVVRGAVLSGLEGTEPVVRRKARRHYGNVCTHPFNGKKHSASSKYWDDVESMYNAGKQMDWFIKRGQTVSSTEPILLPFYITGKTIRTDTHKETLVYSEAENAPEEFSDERRSATKVLCKLAVELSSTPRRAWRKKSAADKSYYELSFDLGMQIHSGGLRFHMEIDGEVYGSIVASFE